MALIRPVALTIAGSDSSGGAGVVADLKTFESLGVWGTVALTAVTAQNSLGVAATHVLPPEVIAAQIDAVAGDLGVAAAKTGMLATAECVVAVAEALRRAGITQVVVDPVSVSKHGDVLLSDDGLDALRRELVPMATVLTPNLSEAAALTNMAVDTPDTMVVAAQALRRLGAEVVMVKGGHLAGDATSPDLVCSASGIEWLEGPRLAQTHTHGTGCVLSAAIAGYLAQRHPPEQACAEAKAFVAAAIAAGGALGQGIGPIDPGLRTGC